jgi:hypothetical protein
MRRFFIIMTICLIAVSELFSTTIRMNYFFDNPIILQKDDYQTINFNNTSLEGEIGKASLPFKAISILLPPGEEAVSVKFLPKNKIEISGKFNLYPRQASIPLSKKSESVFSKNEDFYNSNFDYPENFNFNQTTQFLNGHSIFMTTISPLKYNPKLQKVFYYKSISVIVTTEKTEKAQKSLQNLSNNNLQLIKEFVQNKNALNLYASRDSRTDDYELLILTGETFVNDVNFDSLRTFYKNKGIASNIVSVQSIYGTMDGVDNPEKIRNYIIQEYQNHNIQYVLLGGDVEIIPYRGFFCHVISGDGVEDNDIPGDIYYSSLDGNWNDDGDNHWGEPGEDDLLPDVSVGRISFSNSEELQNQIHKSISYQSNPVQSDLNKQFLVGEDLWQDPQTWGGDAADLFIGHHEDNGYISDGIPEAQPTEKLYDRDLPSHWTPTELISHLNEGHNFIDHIGHSNATYNMRLINSDITNANFSQVNGIDHNYEILYTHGCICGSFDSNDCIAERMTNIDNFLAAFVGNSRYGWFNEGSTDGPSEHLNREFLTTIYTEKRSEIAYAHLRSKVISAPWVTAPDQWEDGALRWVYYDCNVLGDPLLHIWPDVPMEIQADYDAQISLNTENYAVTISNNEGNLANVLCAVLQNNEIIGKAVTDENGVANIQLSDNLTVGTAKLSVWGYDILPVNYNLEVIPTNQPFLNLNSFSTWNGTNESVNIGNEIQLSLNYENIGDIDISDVDFILNCDDSYVTISSDSIHFDGNIPANSNLDIPGNFVFNVASNVTDQEIIHLNIQANSGDYTWTNTLEIPINAPSLNINQALIDDSNENNNHVLDQNENDILHISLENTGHYATQNGTISLACDVDGISFDSNQTNFANINAGEEFQSDFNINVGQVEQNIVPIHIIITNDFCSLDKVMYFSIGYPKEDFETGNLQKFNWIASGDADWFATPENSQEGEYNLQSGDINNSESISLSLNINVDADGNISFYKSVSSEEGYDFLKFYIDGNLMDSWSGIVGWEQETYPLTAGTHSLKWEYSKDSAVSAGDDCANLDNIVFPALSLPIKENTPFKSPRNFTLGLPTRTAVSLNWEVPENSSATLTHYNVYRNDELIGTTEETYFDEDMPNLDLLTYYVTASYENPTGESLPSNYEITTYITSNSNQVNDVLQTKLIGNFPNPFIGGNCRGSGTKILYNLKQTSNVNLAIYNIKGQLIRILVNTKQNSGIHGILWNGQNYNNKKVASGVYFYKLKINNHDISVKKCLILQ